MAKIRKIWTSNWVWLYQQSRICNHGATLSPCLTLNWTRLANPCLCCKCDMSGSKRFGKWNKYVSSSFLVKWLPYTSQLNEKKMNMETIHIFMFAYNLSSSDIVWSVTISRCHTSDCIFSWFGISFELVMQFTMNKAITNSKYNCCFPNTHIKMSFFSNFLCASSFEIKGKNKKRFNLAFHKIIWTRWNGFLLHFLNEMNAETSSNEETSLLEIELFEWIDQAWINWDNWANLSSK